MRAIARFVLTATGLRMAHWGVYRLLALDQRERRLRQLYKLNSKKHLAATRPLVAKAIGAFLAVLVGITIFIIELVVAFAYGDHLLHLIGPLI